MPAKRWLAAYSPGVPAEIDPDRYSSLVALLEASFVRFAAQPAFTNLGTTLDFGQVERLSRAFAAYLQALPGLKRGDRVAIMVPNTLQSPVALFGVLRAGMVAVNVNPMYTYPELEHQLGDSGARAVVVLENFAHTLSAALPRTKVEAVIVTAVAENEVVENGDAFLHERRHGRTVRAADSIRDQMTRAVMATPKRADAKRVSGRSAERSRRFRGKRVARCT